MSNRKLVIFLLIFCACVVVSVCVHVCWGYFHFRANEFKDDCIILQQLNQAQHHALYNIEVHNSATTEDRLFAFSFFCAFSSPSFKSSSSPIVFLALFVRRNTLMGHLSHFLWMETRRSFSR